MKSQKNFLPQLEPLVKVSRAIHQELAAKGFYLSQKAVYRRLLRLAHRQKLFVVVDSYRRGEHERKKYFISLGESKKARKYLVEALTRKRTIEQYQKARGISRRGAELFLQRRLRSGKTLEEIWQEISGWNPVSVKSKNNSGVGGGISGGASGKVGSAEAQDL